MLRVKDVSYVGPPKGMPEELDVLGEGIEVRYSDNLLTDRECHGVSIAKESLVVVDTNASPTFMRRTLLHEAIHAILAVNDTHGMDHDQEETVVRALTAGLFHFLRNNNPFWFDELPDDGCPDDCDCEPVMH